MQVGAKPWSAIARMPRPKGPRTPTGHAPYPSPTAARTSPFQTSAFIFTRSTMPTKLSSAPMGSWMGSGLAPRLEMTCEQRDRAWANVFGRLQWQTGAGWMSGWLHWQAHAG